MKRSKRVVLTLLIPAMAAFGCAQQSMPDSVGADYDQQGQQTAQDCDTPAKPGEPEKPKCHPVTTAGHGTSSRYYGRRSFFPWFFWSHSHGRAASHISPVSHGSTHSTSSTTHHTTRGGFGGTGSHLSGGS